MGLDDIVLLQYAIDALLLVDIIDALIRLREQVCDLAECNQHFANLPILILLPIGTIKPFTDRLKLAADVCVHGRCSFRSLTISLIALLMLRLTVAR